MVWTSVAAATSPTWMNENPQGKEQYDQSNITYDSAATFYDGTNPNQWSNASAPTTPSWVSIAKPT